MPRPQRFSFALTDSLLAEVGEVPLDALHRDVDAICRCIDAVGPLCERLGIRPPRPHLAGFSYSHLSTLGAEVVFAEGSEPNVRPLLRTPEDIDRLREPDDCLAAGVVPERLRTLDALLARRPDAVRSIGHIYEGPLTSAALLMGPDFFILPYDDPVRAHRLLDFCVRSSIRYAHAISERLGTPMRPGAVGIPDDFAGILPPQLFPEFVLPYWDAMFEGLGATARHLHSELLRPEHLPLLAHARISEFDPSADQFLTPQLLRKRCPVPFSARILTWHIRDNDAPALEQMYRSFASCEPTSISFYMTFMAEEPKIQALLAVARELAR